MKYITLVLLSFLISNHLNGQVLKVQTGISVSSLHARREFMGDVLTKQYEPIIGHSLFVGASYLNKKYYSLSSNIGLVRKGGKETLYRVEETGQWEEGHRKQTLDYVSINTAADFKYPIREKITPFVSVGPRVDLLLDDAYSKLFISGGYKKGEGLNGYNYGVVLGGGVTFDFPKTQIGLRGDYFLNAKEVVSRPEEYTWAGGYPKDTVKDKTYTVNMQFGYKL